MADITVKAAYGSVVEDDGFLFVGFAEGEDDDENYVLFRQAADGGPVWFEVGDETFGAEDAVATLTAGPLGFEVTLRPEVRTAFGFATSIAVRIGPGCEDAEPALNALQDMMGARWQTTAQARQAAGPGPADA